MFGQCFIYILIYLEVKDALGISSDIVFDISVERISQLWYTKCGLSSDGFKQYVISLIMPNGTVLILGGGLWWCGSWSLQWRGIKGSCVGLGHGGCLGRSMCEEGSWESGVHRRPCLFLQCCVAVISGAHSQHCKILIFFSNSWFFCDWSKEYKFLNKLIKINIPCCIHSCEWEAILPYNDHILSSVKVRILGFHYKFLSTGTT